MRFFIILSLGVLAFITFLVAGTIIGLMWLDSWSCGECKQYPVGLYILGLLGLLFAISIGVEASDAPGNWYGWMRDNWTVFAVVVAIILTYFIVLNGWCWF